VSSGFVKEDDYEEIPTLTPRADLPEGVTNYVTQFGIDEFLIKMQE
jgi:transcription elongation factor GreB